MLNSIYTTKFKQRHRFDVTTSSKSDLESSDDVSFRRQFIYNMASVDFRGEKFFVFVCQKAFFTAHVSGVEVLYVE